MSCMVWILIGCCLHGRKKQRRKCMGRGSLRDHTVMTVVMFLFILYPALVKQVAKFTDCVNVYNKVYFVPDLELECYTGDHLLYFTLIGIPQICIWVFGLPFAAGLVVFRFRKRLHKRNVLFRYGILYRGYRGKRWWWEAVLVARKVSIVYVGVLGTSMGITVQPVVCLFLVFVCLALHILGQPFHRKRKGKHVPLQEMGKYSFCL